MNTVVSTLVFRMSTAATGKSLASSDIRRVADTLTRVIQLIRSAGTLNRNRTVPLIRPGPLVSCETTGSEAHVHVDRTIDSYAKPLHPKSSVPIREPPTFASSDRRGVSTVFWDHLGESQQHQQQQQH
jgi:hypothetical protein